MRLLFIGVPGICIVILGATSREWPAIALGCILVGDFVYGCFRGTAAKVGPDPKRMRRSFIVAGVIGASFAITGFAEQRYVLAVAGSVLVIGALARLYRKVPQRAH